MSKISVSKSKLAESVSINISPIVGYSMEELYFNDGYKETGKKIEINAEYIKDIETYKEFQKKLIDLVMDYTY